MRSGYIISLFLKFFLMFVATDLTSCRIIRYPTLRRSRIARIPSTFQLTSGYNVMDADSVNIIGGSSHYPGLSMMGVGGVPGHGGLLGGTFGLQPQTLGLRSPLGLRGVGASPLLLTSFDRPDYPSVDSPDFVVARSGSLSDLARAAQIQSMTDADNIVIG